MDEESEEDSEELEIQYTDLNLKSLPLSSISPRPNVKDMSSFIFNNAIVEKAGDDEDDSGGEDDDDHDDPIGGMEYGDDEEHIKNHNSFMDIEELLLSPQSAHHTIPEGEQLSLPMDDQTLFPYEFG